MSHKNVSFEVEGDQLSGVLYTPAEPNGAGVVFVHGWKSNKLSPAPYAERLVGMGYHCLTFDLRGMGASEGNVDTLTRADFLDNCLAAYDCLADAVELDAIHVVGSSFGSYMACLVSEHRKVASLVLRVPADYDNAGFDDEPQVIISDRLDEEGINGPRLGSEHSFALDALAKFDGHVLVVESEKDAIISHEMLMRFVHAVPDDGAQHIVMKGAPHSLGAYETYKQEFGDILEDWFA